MTPLLFALLLQTPDQIAKDRAFLTDGVGPITAPGALPGPVLAASPQSVVFFSAGKKSERAPIFVAGHVLNGRVILNGHGGFFAASNLKDANNTRLLTNSLKWLAGKSENIRIGFWGEDGQGTAVGKLGYAPIRVDRSNLESTLPALDILLISQSTLDEDAASQNLVMKWLKNGHGLMSGGPAWGWHQLNPGKSVRDDLSINRMLLPFGIGLADGTADGNYVPVTTDTPLFQPSTAIDALAKGGLDKDDQSVATSTIQSSLSLLPANGQDAQRIKKLAKAEGSDGIPTAQNPIKMSMPFTRLELVLDAQQMDALPVDKVTASPAAKTFPGEIEPGAKRVSATVSVDTSVPEWHGTGMYAAPGEMVIVTVPANAVAAGLSIRTDAHSDELWHLDKWERYPSVSRTFPITSATTKVASPFGGTVYIDVPARCKLGKIDVAVANAVAAPHFVRGQTTLAEWQKQIAQPGAPWVDLEGRSVIITVPRKSANKVKDPEKLMAFWDEMMDNVYQFYAAPRRPRPERYCADQQISAGYMHSGYPIMTWLDVADTFCDIDLLRGQGKTWGFFHEMGHNFQQPEWTWDGCGEVTNNLFSLYGSEKLNGITPATFGIAHKAMLPDNQEASVKKYLANGAKFSTWTSDPFLALTMFSQLRTAFGWEPFTAIFADYQAMPTAQKPKSNEEKISRFMVMFSKKTGKNLAPFFTAWGLPTSQSARESINSLASWMPADWPK